jgi:hypothetical protein
MKNIFTRFLILTVSFFYAQKINKVEINPIECTLDSIERKENGLFAYFKEKYQKIF